MVWCTRLTSIVSVVLKPPLNAPWERKVRRVQVRTRIELNSYPSLFSLRSQIKFTPRRKKTQSYILSRICIDTFFGRC